MKGDNLGGSIMKTETMTVSFSFNGKRCSVQTKLPRYHTSNTLMLQSFDELAGEVREMLEIQRRKRG